MIAPVDLPVTAYYPALQEFAVKEDESQASQRVLQAEAALTKSQAAIATAKKKGDEKSRRGSSRGRRGGGEATRDCTCGADIARGAGSLRKRRKYGLTPKADVKQLALAAGKAERELALCQAQEQKAVGEQELAAAKSALKPAMRPRQMPSRPPRRKLPMRRLRSPAAHAALAEPSATYTPLGEQLPHQSTGRRLAFAKWLTDRQNPLAARVAINHIWLRHFGAPLVDNMFDFGLRRPNRAISRCSIGWRSS